MMKKKLCFLLLVLVLNSCKKDDPIKLISFKGMSQEFNGQAIPLFEITGYPKVQEFVYTDKAVYGSGFTLFKMGYKIGYIAENLSSATYIYGVPHQIAFELNDRKKIIGSKVDGTKSSIVYTYDNLDRLSFVIDGFNTHAYEYDSDNNLTKETFKYNGVKLLETIFSWDGHVNPLFGLPLGYLYTYLNSWAPFTLSKHNLTKIQTKNFDGAGKLTSDNSYFLKYTYDQNGRPITLEKYYNSPSTFVGSYTYNY